MNVNAIESMENFAKQVLRIPEKSRNEFFESLRVFLSDEEILTLKKCVSIYHIMTEPILYKTIENSLGEQLYKEFNRQK